MTLTLTIANTDRLGQGAPIPLVLDGYGATIGRSSRCDWMLPDPDRYVSSRHCEVAFVDGGYILSDLSSNGTKLNGAAERMKGPRKIEHGDRFAIGRYDVVAVLHAAVGLVEPAPAAPGEVGGQRPREPIAPVAAAGWFGSGDAASPPRPVPAPPDPALLLAAFAAGAGLEVGQLKAGTLVTFERAGSLLRHLVTGLAALVEARSRAKSEMGAERTALSFDGNNPIKFARRADHALAQLLNVRERGFMDAAAAVDDAFDDLQAHQLATLKAMQGALRATLDRFSPTAIRGRAEGGGRVGRIMPGARDAALWQAYEREFAGVADGSDAAFMDVFAAEFRRAYGDIARSA